MNPREELKELYNVKAKLNEDYVETWLKLKHIQESIEINRSRIHGLEFDLKKGGHH